MRLIQFGSIRRCIQNGEWVRTSIFRPTNAIKRNCYCQFAGKYLNENFRHYYTSSVNFLSVSRSEENISASIPELLLQVEKISDLADDEFLNIISQLCQASIEFDHNCSENNLNHIAAAIDNECVRRAQKWDLATSLLALEKFFPKARTLCPQFLMFLLKKKYRKALKSPTPVMIKYLESMNFYKFWLKYYTNWYLIEFTLVKNVDQLTLSEISTFLFSLICLKGKITNENLMIKLVNKFIDNIDNMNDRILSNYLHFLGDQLQTTFKTSVSFKQILNVLPEKISKLEITGVGKAALICLYDQNFDFQLLDRIAEKLINELPDVRVTAMEEIISTLVFFNYNSRDIYQNVIDSFKVEPMQTLMLKHPKRLTRLVGHMCILGIYPYEYINLILSKDFLHKTFGKKLSPFNVLRDVMIINDCVQIECPDYQGHRLDEDLQERLHKHWSSYLHKCFNTDNGTKSTQEFSLTEEKPFKLSSYNKIILETRNILYSILGGPKFLHTCYILPCLPRPNLVYFLDKQKNPIEIPERILSSLHLNSQEIDENLERFAVLSARQHPTLKGDYYMIWGKDIAKVRLLKKFNFNVVVIIEELWFAMNESERRNYLCKLIG